MSASDVQDVFIDLRGQDDNLGDTALRAGYLDAVRGEGRHFHLWLGWQTADYVSGYQLTDADTPYFNRAAWVAASDAATRPVHLFNTGEATPQPGSYPPPHRSAQLEDVISRGGAVILAGLGLRNPKAIGSYELHPVLRQAAVVSWRDEQSRQAAGFGDAAPDWAFALGSSTADWVGQGSRPLLTVTLRFDRGWPEPDWLAAVRELAVQTSTRIVTVAQVARDAPRAVRLAEELGGEYLVAASTKHSDLDSHVRSVYGRSLAVVSDRAHALIIGATEGAYPIGSAKDPQKLKRILGIAGLSALTGRQTHLPELSSELAAHLADLAPAVAGARESIAALRRRMQEAMQAVA